MTFTSKRIRNAAAVLGLTLAVPASLVLSMANAHEAQQAQHEATQTAEQTCTELAVWPAMVATHGEDEAAGMWADMVADGWTNPRSGDATYLVQPGCADAWN
jgi:hypothetical protein